MTRISDEGRFAPRRLFLGSEVNAAQSKGECPGSRTTGLDGRCGLPGTASGASVLLDGREDGGTRRFAAAEGGVRREVVTGGRGGGGIRFGLAGRVGAFCWVFAGELVLRGIGRARTDVSVLVDGDNIFGVKEFFWDFRASLPFLFETV